MRTNGGFGCVLATALVLIVSVPPPLRAADPVRPADARDAFVVAGTGGSGGGAGSQGGSCGGCVTTIYVPVCVMTIDFDSPQPGSPCLPVGSACAPGERYLRAWRAGPGEWIEGDARCRSMAAAVSLAQVAVLVRERVVHHLPALRPTFQPAARALVRVPVLLDSGQTAGPLSWRDDVAGITVTTTVRPSWTWTFPDGATLTTGSAGSRWPDTAVSHTFTSVGRRRIDVSAEWRGSYRIAGLAEQPIDGSVTQTAAGTVTVTAARAVLRPPRPDPAFASPAAAAGRD